MKVVRLSALRTGRLYPPGNIPGTHFYQRLSRPQGHSAAGWIMSRKNFNGTTGDRTRDLPTCSAVPQPTSLQPSEAMVHATPAKIFQAVTSQAWELGTVNPNEVSYRQCRGYTSRFNFIFFITVDLLLWNADIRLRHWCRQQERRNGQLVLDTGRLADLVLKNSSHWSNLKYLSLAFESKYVCVCVFVVFTDTDACYAEHWRRTEPYRV